jgi:hypothetical protein
MNAMRLADRFPNKPELTGPTIDYYPHAEAPRPSNETTLYDLITAIRGEDFAAAVAEIRALIAAGDKKAADALKKKLPAVSISGTVDGRRAKAAQEGRFTHSGLLQIDLDAKDNVGWTVEEMREALQSDPRMVAVFVSASGEGVKGIARIAADHEKHKAAFLAAEAHFKSLKLTIDGACKDPVRLCFVSHDPRAWLRMDTDEMFVPVELAVVEEISNADVDDEDPDDDEPGGRVGHSAAGGLVIRHGCAPLDAATVRQMLAVIPPRPDYDEWLKVASAVWDALGEAEGTAALCAWSPEEVDGEYAHKYENRLKEVKAGTLVHRAETHGYARPRPVSTAIHPDAVPLGKKDPNAIPDHIFPVPNGDVGNDLAARHIMAIIAPTRRLFNRSSTVHEVIIDRGEPRLDPIKPSRLTSVIEEFGPRVMIRERREDGTPRWRSKIMAANHCEMLLNSSAARELLPDIQQITGSPVLAWTPDGPELLGHGWHAHAGGTYVTGRQQIPTMSLAEARAILFDEVLCDIAFAGEGEASRAAASFISPALKIGRWIDDDFPVDVAEADQSQAGKSYRHKLIAAVYGETPYTITNSTGGVGSFDERIGGALIAGRPIITLENIRGRIDSQTLESAIRGQSRVTARSFRACVEVDTSPFIWQLSTNGAELTRDLANRAVITRIRKQPDGYKYRQWPEGEILHHIRGNQPRYLGAIHAILREWAAAGCPRSDETGHDFRGWVQALDWIVQNILKLYPLMTEHREQQMRTANPRLQWLRDILRAMAEDGLDPNTGITASDFAEAAEEHCLEIPGRRPTSNEAAEVSVGRVLSRVFKDAGGDSVTVDGINLTRQMTVERDACKREIERKIYVVTAI